MPPSVVLIDSSWRILSPELFRELLEFYLLNCSETCSLINCAHRANTHQDCQSVMNFPPVETILFKYMRSSTFMELPSYLDMHLIASVKGSLLNAQCSSSWTPLSLSNQIVKRNALILSIMFITHIHAVKCVFRFQNRWSHSQSWWYASFWHSFKCNCTITSVGSHNHVFRG